MAGRVTVFDFTQVIATFGPIFIQGFADGDAISVEFDGDRETKSIGASGDVVRVKSANKAATVIFRLQRGSPSIALFRSWLQTFKAPFDVSPLIIKDIGGLTIHQSLQAWIEGDGPAPTFSADAPVEEWRIGCALFETITMVPATG